MKESSNKKNDKALNVAIMAIEAIALPLVAFGTYGGIQSCLNDMMTGGLVGSNVFITLVNGAFTLGLGGSLIKDISKFIKAKKERKEQQARTQFEEKENDREQDLQEHSQSKEVDARFNGNEFPPKIERSETELQNTQKGEQAKDR